MADENLILQLLELALQTGRTAEEVCADHPELLVDVRVRLARLERVRSDLDLLFPEPSAGSGPLPFPDPELPQIPGHDVQAVLGHGGMGVVYRARHIRLNRLVGVKMLLAGPHAAPRELARFRREVEALAELGHPNVVQIHEAGECNGQPYFTMELMEGGSLAEKLAGAPQPADRAAALVSTLAGAVHAAHTRGIVHRDLKPANILLTPDGTPKISDFGLAWRLDPAADLTRTGTRLGTPSYMAPEQASGADGASGPSVDVYALGAILYELLTGRPPFRSDSPAETERQVIHEDPAPPSRLNARVPRDLETICLKCLEKDPTRRYPTALALAEDLGRYRRGEPITARRAGRIERAYKWVRRHPARGAAGSLATLAVVSALAAGWWLYANRVATERAVVGDLTEAEDALERSDWTSAHTALERAKARLGTRGSTELRQRVDRTSSSLQLVTRLDEIQTQHIDSAGIGSDEGFDDAGADRAYASAFLEAGLGSESDPPEVVAARVRTLSTRRALVSALDHWAVCTRERTRLVWILAVARLADPEPTWRDRVRDPGTGTKLADLEPLAATAPLDRPSVALHLALAHRLRRAGGDDVGFLRRVQFANPDDFWVTFHLALSLDLRQEPDAIGFYQAARAIRPRGLAALNNLGAALHIQGRISEELELRRNAVLLFPDSAIAHGNLGFTARVLGHLDEAAAHYRTAMRLDPSNGGTRAAFARVLFDQGALDECRAEARRALELLPADKRQRPEFHPAQQAARELSRELATRLIERCDRMLAMESRLPGIIKGTDRPGAAERIVCAELCARRRFPTSATRIYAEAFGNEKRLATDVRNGYRYSAARVAVRAGLGDGADVPPDGPPRVALRNLALSWLRSDRDLWAVHYTQGGAADRRSAAGAFTTRLGDAAQADVRGPAIDRLTPDERRRWSALWLSVRQLASGALPQLEPARSAAQNGEWTAAATQYAQVAELNLIDLNQAWYEFAAVQLLSGDQEGYSRTRGHTLERGPGAQTVRAYHIARICTLTPGPSDNITRALLVARATQRSNFELTVSETEFWALTERGALLHRSGRSKEAVPFFERSLAKDERPGAQVVNWLWLALAHHALGETDAAKRWLEKAARWLDQFKGRGLPNAPGLDAHNWLEALVLRREAEALLGPVR
jgi:serine/threonine-protein kinase